MGKTLRELRKEQNRKLEDFAHDAQVSAGALSYWENGHRRPNAENLDKLAGALDLPLSVVLAALRLSREERHRHAS